MAASKVRLKDIAQACGLSISTVSRVLNGSSSHRPGDETAVRILRAAEDLGFIPRPERVPRRLISSVRQEKPCSIGCILTSEHETFVSPFFSRLLACIQNEIAEYKDILNYRLAVANIKDPGFSRFLTADTLDCAVMLGRTSRENIEMLRGSIPHIVYAGVNRIGCGMDEIICDSYKASCSVVEYLVSLGHTDIGYIGPTQQKIQVANEHRYDGFIKGLEKAGVPLNPAYVSDSILTTAAGYESACTLVHAGALPTAVFCANDTVALGAMKAFLDEGIRIPDDLSIVGFDDIDTVSYVKPALTTVSVPTDALAHFAVKVLIDRMEFDRNFPVSVNIPYTLAVRESCRSIV